MIPWGHHICILTHCNNTNEAFLYVNKVAEGNWSRRMLEDNMEDYTFSLGIRSRICLRRPSDGTAHARRTVILPRHGILQHSAEMLCCGGTESGEQNYRSD